MGASIPTLKRMVARGTLEGFRTPGGHLRILAESIEAARDGHKTPPPPMRDASPVLQNRRERLEGLTLEAQEMRAGRDLARLRRDEKKEAERREAEAQAREAERDAQERRQSLTERALRTLTYSATGAERVRASAAVRKALGALDASADECEMLHCGRRSRPTDKRSA